MVEYALTKKKFMELMGEMIKDNEIILMTGDKCGTWSAPSTKKNHFFRFGFSLASIFFKEKHRKGIEPLMAKNRICVGIIKLEKDMLAANIIEGLEAKDGGIVTVNGG